MAVVGARGCRHPVRPREQRREGKRHSRRDLLRVMADGAVHFLVGERLPRVVGRAVGLAAAALGARVCVEDFLPGEVAELRNAEAGRVLQVELSQLAHRLQTLEVDGRQSRDDVEVLPHRQEVEEGHHDGDVEQHAEGHRVGRGARRHAVEEPLRDLAGHRQVPGNRAGALRQRGGVDEHVGPEDADDHAEDEHALPRERHPLLLGDHAVVEEDRAPQRSQDVDHVLAEQVRLPEPRLVRQERQVEGGIVRQAEGGQRAQLRHDEGDEDPDVRHAGGALRLRRHALLPEAVFDQLLGARERIVPAHLLAREEQRADAVGHRPQEQGEPGRDDHRGDDGSH